MNTTLAALVVFGCLVAAVLSEKILRRLLREMGKKPNEPHETHATPQL